MTQLPTPEELADHLLGDDDGEYDLTVLLEHAIRADREAIAKCIQE